MSLMIPFDLDGSVLDWLSDLDWGSVPAWLGAGSLILAYAVFYRDRGNAERAQIDLVGAWATVEYERRFPNDANPDPVVEGKVTGHVRNASQLPVKIAQIAYKTETRWLVEDPEPRHPDGSPVAWTVTPGTEPHFAFQEMRVPPQETIDAEFAVNVAHMAPTGATHLSITDGIKTHVEWLLVVDNAGRRWVLNPEKGGRAKRVRRRWRPKDENMLRTW